ncbi:MaoC-like dehydratase domain protein [Candidatus Magnetomorum sp. HK-1]|nr:MaoC-like dehydratase domain protein [Candidatus Magnetomorum sp. HK-1]
MSVSSKHILSQGPVIKALLKTAGTAMYSKLVTKNDMELSSLPGPVFTDTLQARKSDLINDYILNTGGQPGGYRGKIPSHMFPQWGVPILARTIQHLPYDISRILNGGVRFEINQDLQTDKPLFIKARLLDIDDNGKRAIFKQELITGNSAESNALVCQVTAILPLKEKEKKTRDDNKSKKQLIPMNAREIDRWSLTSRSGLDFAILTGDFNPVHWIPAYARLFGFSNSILHGFSSMARAIESLNKVLWSGNTSQLKKFETRFVRPLLLPNTVSVFVDDNGGVFVGHSQGGVPYLIGNYTTK